MNFRHFPSPNYPNKVGQLIRLIQPYICNGKMQWMGINDAYQIWQAAHLNINDYYVVRCENTVAISNAPNTPPPTSTITLNGSNNACTNTTQLYAINDPIAGSSYIWTIGGNYTIVAGCGTNDNYCNLQWNGGTAGTVSVIQTPP